MRYRLKRCDPIDAAQWTGVNTDEVVALAGPNVASVIVVHRPIRVRYREVWFQVDPGEWIVRDPSGGFRMMTDEVFKSTYEEMVDGTE